MASPPPPPGAPAAASQAFPGPYPEPFERDYARLTRKITPAACAQLRERGFVVIDECFGHGWASALLAEMKWLHHEELFKPNKTQFALTPHGHQSPQVVQFIKPNIFEVDLHDAAIRRRVPELEALFESTGLLEALALHFPDYDLQMSTPGRTLKLQRNAGHGGCFPCHYDNPGAPNKRKLTCLLYLNDAWHEGDGGEVQLFPFLKPTVTVAPRMDRLVIFMSDWMLHRVLPSRAERYCLTVWIDGGAVNQTQDTQLRISPADMADWLAFLERLRKSPQQRLLSRAVYEEEYLDSLTECMATAANGLSEMLQSHEAQVRKLQSNAPLHAFITRLRDARELNTDAPEVIH